MKQIPLIAMASFVLALSACSGGEAPQPEASSEAPQTPGETAVQETAGAALQENTIPEVLRGRWGIVPGDCTSTASDAKGLMTVSSNQLTFYESVAELGDIDIRRPDSIAAPFTFSGEGESWILDVSLSTPDGGKTLIRQDHEADAAPRPLTYTKCP